MAIEIEDENIARDLPKFQNYLTEIKKLADDLNTSLQETLKNVQDEKSSIRNGVSLLDVKYHALLQYVVDLVALINCKVTGENIAQFDFVTRIVENRVVLEKLRPLEKKLQYQIDKILQMTDDVITADDPLNLKPNLDNLDDDEEVDSDDQDRDDTNAAGDKKYVPPHIASVQFEEEERDVKRQRERERLLKKSSMLRDVMEEMTDDPVEITNEYKSKHDKERTERERYEFDNYKRVNLTKKQLNAEKHSLRKSELDSLTVFGSDFLYEDKGTMKASGSGGGKRKRSGGKNKNKKFKKRH